MPATRRRSITTQFRLALILIAGPMTLVSLGLLVLAHRAASGASQLYGQHLRPLMRLNAVTEGYSIGITGTLRGVRSGTLEPAQGQRLLRLHRAEAQAAWLEFRRSQPPSPNLVAVQARLTRVEALIDPLEALLPQGISRELGSFGDHLWLPEVIALNREVETLRQEQDRIAGRLIRDLEAQARWTTRTGLVLLVLALTLAATLSQLLSHRFQRSVRTLLERLRQVAGHGNPVAEPLAGEDELEVANQALNLTLERLQFLMAALRDQEAFQRAFLEGAQAAIIGLDLDGKVNRWNRAAELMLGYPADAVLGVATPDLWRLPEELRQLADDLGRNLGRPLQPGVDVLQAAAAIPEFSTECQYRHRDGHRVPVLLALSQVRTPDGRLLGSMGVALDLTKLKHLEAELKASEARYRRLAERLPGVVYQLQVDPDGRRTWLFISPQCEAIYGAPPSVWLADPDYPLRRMSAEDRERFLAQQRAAAANLTALEWEGRISSEPPGPVKWLRVRSNPTRHPNGGILWDGLMEDISQLKAAEAALIASETLARQASQAKSAFLANMSHELRTPLSVILGYAGLLAKDAGRSGTDRVQLEKIQRAGEHLLMLINDVLSLTKIETGRMELSIAPFVPARLFADLEALFRLTAQARGLAFTVQAEAFPAQVAGDLSKLRQVLVNLLGNAFKFTEQGRVAIQARWRQGRAEFQVEDTGPGIAPAEQAQLFQVFQQTASGAAAGGAGLGLHISQSLVTLMGGQISLDSGPGRGSRFRFSLPLAETAGAEPGSTETEILGLAPGQAPVRVLVVDDRPENREILTGLLERIGFQCTSAEHGAAGLERWERERPQVILMDLRMPVLDGFQTVAVLRAREQERQWPRTPVLAISASVYDVSVESLVAQGFDDFLSKPVVEAQLLAVLGRLLDLDYRRAAPGAPAAAGGEAGLANLVDQAPAWRQAFTEQLLLGDLTEAEALLPQLADPALADALRQRLQAYNIQEILDHLA